MSKRNTALLCMGFGGFAIYSGAQPLGLLLLIFGAFVLGTSDA